MKPRLKTELDFLAAVERGEVVTQATLSRQVGVAVGLINALIKRAMMKGYVKARSAPYKRYAYYLTPKGFAEKSRLVAEYLEVSLEFFRDARRQYAELFLRARNSGMRRFILIGSGELAEIATLAAQEAEVELVAIVDVETNRDRLYGVAVARSVAEAGEWDGVVLTESRHPQESYAKLLAEVAADRIFAPALLKVVADEDFDVVDVGEARVNAMTEKSPLGWYVVNTLPNQEVRAELNLRQQGFASWLPALQRTRRHARKVETVSAPLFPGYLFVRLDVARQPWVSINSTYGIRRLICRHDVPARLPNGFVDDLRAEVENGGIVAPEDRLSVGDSIRVTEGPFADCVGRLLSFPAKDRVTLLLTLLSREISIVMPKHSVAAVV